MKPSSLGTGASTPCTLGVFRRIGGSEGSCEPGCDVAALSGAIAFSVTPDELGSRTARCDCVDVDRGGAAADGVGTDGALVAAPPLRGGLLAGIAGVTALVGGTTARCCDDDAFAGSGGGAWTALLFAADAVRGTGGGVTARIDVVDAYAPGDGMGGAATVRRLLVEAVR